MRGSRPQQCNGNVTATALRRRDGKVTATAAMVGEAGLRARPISSSRGRLLARRSIEGMKTMPHPGAHPTARPTTPKYREHRSRRCLPMGNGPTRERCPFLESEDFASNDQEKEVSSNEEADSEANQPNDKVAGVALRTQRGAAAAWDRPAAGAGNARLAAFWVTQGQGKGVWTLTRRPDSSARCPNSKTKAVVSNFLQ